MKNLCEFLCEAANTLKLDVSTCVLVKTNGKTMNVSPKNGSEFTKSELEKLVGKPFLCYALEDGATKTRFNTSKNKLNLAIVGKNDESMFDNDKFFNQVATDAMQDAMGSNFEDCYGDVLFCPISFVEDFVE